MAEKPISNFNVRPFTETLMRSYDPDDKFDREEMDRIGPEPWMLDLLSLNPEYPHWGPHEDYMSGNEESGWGAPIFHESWKEFDIHLDELNEVVHFYFEVDRVSKPCETCDETGYGRDARRVSDDFYDSDGTGRRWCDKITLDEAQALVDRNRCFYSDREKGELVKPVVDDALVARINLANLPGRTGFDIDLYHDAINKHILVKQRCERFGFYVKCKECGGHGYIYTANRAHVGLVLWLIHPRKGASRGVEIANVEREDLPAAFEFLAQAAKRNADRFAKVVSRVR